MAIGLLVRTKGEMGRQLDGLTQRLRAVPQLQRAVHGDPAWQGPPMAQRRPSLPVLVVQLRGTQTEMGAQHGEALKQEGGFKETLDWYPGMASRIVAGPRESVVQGAVPRLMAPVGAHLLARLDAARPAELRARSRAFFAALGRDPNEAHSLGVMDLLQNLIGGAGRLGLGHIGQRWSSAVPGACSTLAAWGTASENGDLRLGRNFDFPGAGVWESAPVVVFCTPATGLRYAFVTTRGADAPCVTVWNEAGLVVTIHTRFHEAIRFDARIAVDLVHEVVRRARTIDEAVAVVREAPIASTWGIVVAAAAERRAVLVEAHAKAVTVTNPNPGEEFLACTNRYQALAMQNGELEPTPGWQMHSDGRHLALRRQALRSLTQGGMTTQQLADLLGSHEDPDLDGVERAAGGILAQPNGVHSVVVDPARQVTLVSVGAVPTGHGPWLEVPWQWDAAPGVRQVDVQAARQAHLADATAPGWAFRQGPTGVAYGHLLESARLEMAAGPVERVAAELQTACQVQPLEPAWQLLAGGFALKNGQVAEGLAHLDAGLSVERSPFFRARLLLWAARACDAAGDKTAARQRRLELAGIAHKGAERYRAEARKDAAQPWTVARAKKTRVAVQLCDLG